MIMCRLLSMVYGLPKPYWITHVTCTCFKETELSFNVHLSCFVDFILCRTAKYMFQVNNKKIRLICWMCSKLKINTAWHRFYCWLWPQSTHQYSVSNFNLKQLFLSRVWKTSHNVLKTQKAIYLFCYKSCEAYFIQRFFIASNWNKLRVRNHIQGCAALWLATCAQKSKVLRLSPAASYA